MKRGTTTRAKGRTDPPVAEPSKQPTRDISDRYSAIRGTNANNNNNNNKRKRSSPAYVTQIIIACLILLAWYLCRPLFIRDSTTPTKKNAQNVATPANLRKTISDTRKEKVKLEPPITTKKIPKSIKIKHEQFPIGCSWECYLDRNPDLEKEYGIPRTEEDALLHYLGVGRDVEGRKCDCVTSNEFFAGKH
mmetsp:Transcript_18933/g.41235  ORF Transcript_18933/g.41235 Transcript_18933/m.41235 type:complete len:191 (-) Transcript_18933:165-737(-)